MYTFLNFKFVCNNLTVDIFRPHIFYSFFFAKGNLPKRKHTETQTQLRAKPPKPVHTSTRLLIANNFPIIACVTITARLAFPTGASPTT